MLFESARLKIDRAKHHIRDLQATLDRYSKSARIEFAPDGGYASVTIDTRSETDTSLIAGDTIHNMRAALDHAFWELMGIDSGKQGRSTYFPIHRGRKVDYEAACKGIETPRNDTKKFLIDIGAYPDGPGVNLCAIHEMDIADKHSLLTTIFSLTALRDCVIVRPDGTREDWARIGAIDNKYGETVVRLDGTAIIHPFGEGRFETQNKPQATLEVLFSDSDFVEFQSVVPTLHAFLNEVIEVVDGLERMVINRS